MCARDKGAEKDEETKHGDVAECFELVCKAYKVVKVDLSDAEPEEVLEKVDEFTEALEEWEKAVVGFQW